MRFSKGDTITASIVGTGLEKATITGIIQKNGKQYYKLKIVNGIATIPVSAEDNYKKLEE